MEKEKIIEIEIERLKNFKNHPFKVHKVEADIQMLHFIEIQWIVTINYAK